jgi:hypothetical protein
VGDSVRIQLVRGKSANQRTVDVKSLTSYFGKANRPATPMGAVMAAQYEKQAAEEQIEKNTKNETMFRLLQKFKGIRSHTRASRVASEHVWSTIAPGPSKELYKMAMFKNVESRVRQFM